MVKIRLKRLGMKKRPYYRIVVMDSRSARNGKSVEELGYYHPVEKEEVQLKLNEERIKYWLGVGAQPSATVKKLLNQQDITVK